MGKKKEQQNNVFKDFLDMVSYALEMSVNGVMCVCL